jgi:hypothetical protein
LDRVVSRIRLLLDRRARVARAPIVYPRVIVLMRGLLDL